MKNVIELFDVRITLVYTLEEIFKLFKIDKDSSLIIGSTPLYVLGILKGIPNDFDIVVTGNNWLFLDDVYGSKASNLNYGKMIDNPNKQLMILQEYFQITPALRDFPPVEIFNEIGYDFNFKDYRDRAISISGFAFMNPIDLLCWNMHRGLEKDISRNRIIQEYLISLIKESFNNRRI